MSEATEPARVAAREELAKLRIATLADLSAGDGYVAVRADERGAVQACGDAFFVQHRRGSVALTLPALRSLCRGSAAAPTLPAGRPPARYERVIIVLEQTARRYFEHTKRPETDEELLRIFSALARRPDGRDPHRLFGYLNAAARVCLALEDWSEAELEAVFRRLAQSARTFRTHTTSKNYWEHALSTASADNH